MLCSVMVYIWRNSRFIITPTVCGALDTVMYAPTTVIVPFRYFYFLTHKLLHPPADETGLQEEKKKVDSRVLDSKRRTIQDVVSKVILEGECVFVILRVWFCVAMHVL